MNYRHAFHAGNFADVLKHAVLARIQDGADPGSWELVARVAGWAFALWGTGLYWWAGLLYVRQTVDLLANTPPVAKEHRPIGPPHEGPTPREGTPPHPRRSRQRGAR